jgi:hypothetical protein
MPICPEFLGGSRFRIGTPYRRPEEFMRPGNGKTSIADANRLKLYMG